MNGVGVNGVGGNRDVGDPLGGNRGVGDRLGGNRPPAEMIARALAFVQREAGFAQLVTFGATGKPVGRSTSAFLNDDWSVDLVQRRTHRRNDQLRADPRALVVWDGPPSPDSVNDSPWTFDLGLTIPRVVFVRGRARALDADETWSVYEHRTAQLRAAGHTKAPLRDRADLDANFTGIRIAPERVRLEGFGDGAEAVAWNVGTGKGA